MTKQTIRSEGTMIMRGTVIYGAGDVRFEHLLGPRILSPGDAIVRIAATCVCGSDLWDYRGILKDIQDVDVLRVGTKLRSPDCRREYTNYPWLSRFSRTAICGAPADSQGRSCGN